MKFKFLTSGERKRIISFLKERFGVDGVNYLFIETGKQKFRAFSGSLSRDDLINLGDIAHVENVGLYFMRDDPVGGLRPSLDACHLLEDQICNSVIDFDEAQSKAWLSGEAVDCELEQGIYIVRYKEYLLGCGFSNGKRLFNYLPKERYVRSN